MSTLKQEIDEKQTKGNRCEKTKALIIIGAGTIGKYCAQQMANTMPGMPIKLIGEDNELIYTRDKVLSFLSGKITEHPANHLEPTLNPQIEHLNNVSVKSINTTDSFITDNEEVIHSYHELIFATDSTPYIPDIEGVHLENVFTLRDVSQALELIGKKTKSHHVVILGAGTLGLQTCHAFNELGANVTCIEQCSRVMFNHLDDHATVYVENKLQDAGMRILTQTRIKHIHGEKQVETITLSDGEQIKCDTLVIATGFKPNIKLALDSGIHIGRAIKVDQQLKTNIDNIYAVGECAEHEGIIYGFDKDSYEQVDTLSQSFVNTNTQYNARTEITEVNPINYPIFTMGDNGDNAEERNEIIYRDTRHMIYRKLVLKKGKIVGVIGVGHWPFKQQIQEAINNNKRIWPWQKKKFIRTGNLSSISEEQPSYDYLFIFYFLLASALGLGIFLI